MKFKILVSLLSVILVLLFVVDLFASTFNNPAVDGVTSVAPTDWDANEKVVVDVVGSSDWGTYNDLSGLWVTWSGVGLYIGVSGAFWDQPSGLVGTANAVNLYLDTDYGQGTGIADLSQINPIPLGGISTNLSRTLTIGSGFGCDFGYTAWAGWVDVGFVDLADPNNPVDRTLSVIEARDVPGNTGYEILLPWTVLYPGAAGTVPPNTQIAVVVAIVGNDDSLAGESIPKGADDRLIERPLVVRVDADGDGSPDLGGPDVLEMFEDIGAGMAGVQYGTAVWGDYDNDGDLDVLQTGEEATLNPVARIYRNNGGVFTDIGAGLTGYRKASAAWGDYDNDGYLDILLTGDYGGSGPSTKVYRNNGGTFVEQYSGRGGDSVAWGDYDNDGDLDFLLSGNEGCGTCQGAAIFANEGGVFRDIEAGLIGVELSAGAWGDYDNDGDLDILLSGEESDGTRSSRIYENHLGTFTDIGAGLSPCAYAAVAWGDYDNDGDLDLFVSGDCGNSSSNTKVYRNEMGNFVFVDYPYGGTSAVWGDGDGNGYRDILTAGMAGGGGVPDLALYRNDGSAFTFFSMWSPSTQFATSSVAWGDYDNDNDLDALVTGRKDDASLVSLIFRNNSTEPNSLPSPPVGLQVGSESTPTVTFNWDDATDTETSSPGLTYNLRVGTTPGGNEIISSSTAGSGFLNVPRMGNVNHNNSWHLPMVALPGDQPFFWSVQAVDAGFVGSVLVSEQISTLQPVIAGIEDVPADQGGWLRMTIAAALFDDPIQVDLPVASYNIWQRIDGAVGKTTFDRGPRVKLADPASVAGLNLYSKSGRFVLDGSSTSSFPSGAWEIVGSFSATQQTEYVLRTPTVIDSTGNSGTAWSAYLVTAHTTVPAIWFTSAPDSGYSVDNIEPGVPAALRADYLASGVSLEWDDAPESDFQSYRIYRDIDPAFTPSNDNLVHETATSSWTDPTVNPWGYSYKITVLDHSGNESEAGIPLEVTGVREGIPPTKATLLGAVPNPFNPQTSIAFHLSQSAAVSLRIYDLSGRLVRVLLDGELIAEGRQEAVWNGRDESGRQVASGSYFYRFEAGDFAKTRRMSLVR